MTPALEKWGAFAKEPRLLQFLDGLFDRVGIRVTDTGEEFTCSQAPGRIAFEEGVDPGRVDFVVEIDSMQVNRVADEAATGEFSEIEKYRILLSLVAAPLEYTASLMNNRALGSPLIRKLLRVVDVAHIHLQSPTVEEPNEAYTLSVKPSGWTIEQGIHGDAGRVITLDLANALDFQRKSLAYQKSSGPLATLRYLVWYVGLRRRISKRT